MQLVLEIITVQKYLNRSYFVHLYRLHIFQGIGLFIYNINFKIEEVISTPPPTYVSFLKKKHILQCKSSICVFHWTNDRRYTVFSFSSRALVQFLFHLNFFDTCNATTTRYWVDQRVPFSTISIHFLYVIGLLEWLQMRCLKYLKIELRVCHLSDFYL